MAEFKLEFDNETNISPDEYVEACSWSEVEELVKILYIRHRMSKSVETKFDKNLVALIGKKHMVSKKVEEQIEKLANEFKLYG